MRRCFRGEKSESECGQLLRQNYEHYGILVFELLHLFSPVPGHYRRYMIRNTRLVGFEHWKRAYEQGRGVLFVSSHLGNWEGMVAAGGLAGIPLTMVTKHLKPEWLHKKIEASRLSVNVRGAYEPRTLPLIMRALRKKKAVGFVLDQYAGPPIGIPVPFFGVKVGTLAAVSTLAQRTGAAALPAKTFRDQDGRINVVIEPQLDLSQVINSEEKTTTVLSARVEGWVREYPAQWLWIHRRFKNVVWPES
jgi:KDO2-lipid IV(A) lauroyltransferase